MTSRLFKAVLLAGAVMAVGSTAHAQTVGRVRAPSASADAFAARDAGAAANARGVYGPAPARQSLSLGGRGRFGVKLDVDESTGGDRAWKDVQAGAYFKVTPSLRVGGSLGIGPDTPFEVRPRSGAEQPARVKVESSFRF